MKQTFQFTARIITVVLIFAVLFSYAMFQGGFVSWFLFISFLPFLLYMAALTFYRIDRWEVKRTLSKRVATAGETITVDISIDRKFPFPMYYCVVEEYFPESLMKKDLRLDKFKKMSEETDMEEKRVVKKVSFPWMKRKLSYRYVLNHIPRGAHQIRMLRIKTGDFFGFIRKEHVFEVEDHLVAFPYQRPVRLSEKAYSFEQGASPSFRLNEKSTNVVSGVREYVPGDRVSWIDWKNTAKNRQMMTKEFEQEKNVEMLLILNAVHHNGMHPLSFEGAVEFSASLLGELHNRSSQLAFMTLGDKKRYFPIQQDPMQKGNIEKHLAEIQPMGVVSFAKQLERERSALPRGMVVMVVSHQLDAQIVEILFRLAQKSKQVVFFYVKPARQLDFKDHKLMKKLSNSRLRVQLLTEEQLSQKEFEVST
ncbi:DUF58 domain-containing protein [Halobacillus sp. Marseille-Q1614]|uniref:DUF58 domain-containing protein n=1 Tax=Halobacillus sp. Marseille-Q1614 TaxID=2709134 RepID=UPI00156E4D49|nr:DUF58 domain-containing protein [Halobacillus sp. Marseille-Q1614]